MKVRKNIVDKVYYVYRFLDENNKIIYVGKTGDLKSRIRGHFAKGHLPKKCYSNVKNIEACKITNETNCAIYEIYYINKYKPKYNKIHKYKDRIILDLSELEWINFKKISFDVKKTKTKYVMISYNIPKNLTDADLGKFLKLTSKTIPTSNVLLLKSDSRSNPMTKKDIGNLLNTEIKATERFLRRFINANILEKCIYNNKKAYKINTDYIYVE